MASGRSHKSWFTKLGRAINCLVVQVGPEGGIVRPFFPFNLMFMPKIYDLEHFIPHEKIKNVSAVKRFIRKTVLVDFQTEGGMERRIELALGDQERFMKALSK